MTSIRCSLNIVQKKQWGKYPDELDASVLQRIPVRTNFDDRYFNDKFQAIPTKGYTKMFENMLGHENIRVMLSTDFFDVEKHLRYEKLFYTGPIDQYFRFKKGSKEKLKYRSIGFVEETLNIPDYQRHAVVKYPGTEVPFTHIIEYKHITGQKHAKKLLLVSIPPKKANHFILFQIHEIDSFIKD